MKKNEKKDIGEIPKVPEQPASNIRSYFTKDILDQIAGMGLKEMESVMKEMVSTRYWIALLKYTGMRTPILDSILRSTDPTKDSHKISWSQGCMAGLSDIEGYIIDLNTPKSEKEEGEEGEVPPLSKPEGVIVDGD